MKKYGHIKQLIILMLLIPAIVISIIKSRKEKKDIKELEKKHSGSFAKRREILKYLNSEFLPKLITREYANKLNDAIFGKEDDDYAWSKDQKVSKIVEAQEGYDITINFLFFDEYDADYMGVKNNLNFFFNDVIKAIESKYDTKCEIAKSSTSLDDYYCIKVKMLEDMFDEESGMNN